MTIRRNVDLNTIGQDYRVFCDALNELLNGMFPFARNVRKVVGDTMDDLELYGTIAGVQIDRCDRIYEVEALTFDMIRQTNKNPEIEQVIQIGYAIYELEGSPRERYIAGCNEAFEQFQLRQIEAEAEADNEARNGAALVVSGFDDFRRQGGEFGQ